MTTMGMGVAGARVGVALLFAVGMAACTKPAEDAAAGDGARAADAATATREGTPAAGTGANDATMPGAASAAGAAGGGAMPAAGAADADAEKRECRDESRPPEPGEEDLPPCAGGAEAGGPWRIRGGQNDFHVDTVVCTLAKPFDLRSTAGIVMHMSGGARGGTYTVSGVAAGVTWSGNGTYAVEVTPTDATSLFIEAKGISTVDAPFGRASDSVEPGFRATHERGAACSQGT